MKVFIASIATETNTYSAFPTGRAAFEMNRGKDPVATAFRPHLARWAAEEGHTLVFSLSTFAQPAGATVASAWAALRDELLADLQAAMPVDAVVLPLHGAMVAEGCDDCEGELLERARAIVGPRVPIGVELDLHCHFTERMRRNADILVAYKEYPHTDVLDRLAEVWRLTLDTAAGRIRPVTAVADCRMVGLWHTTREPMRARACPRLTVQSTPSTLQSNWAISSSHRPPPLVKTMLGMRAPLYSLCNCDRTRRV